MRVISILTILICLSSGISSGQEKKTRDQKVREDQQRVTQEGFWIYNDLPKAFREAKETGKWSVHVKFVCDGLCMGETKSCGIMIWPMQLLAR